MMVLSTSCRKKSIASGFGGSCKAGPLASENGYGVGGMSESWATVFQRSPVSDSL